MEPLTNNGSLYNVMETGYKKNPYVYRTSAIFGANASGKSNFVDALSYLADLIRDSYRNSIDSKLNLPIYKLDNSFNTAYFELEGIQDNYFYRYILELSNDGIVREDAYYSELADDKREKCLFKRTPTTFSSPYGIDANIAKQTIKTRLLISELINNRNVQDSVIKGLYNSFFHESSPDGMTDEHLDYVSNFLNKAGINTKLIRKDKRIWAIQKDEKGNNVLFDIDTEISEGTKTLIGRYSKNIRGVLKSGGILVEDELDKSLHPLLVKYIVDLFNNPKTNPNGAQLIFTSHAHYLMDGDTLTRDQIWFTSKENGYSSDLYSLSDFKEIKRKNASFYNEYMYGVFGAVPNIKEE